ncbi:unnamed protein product, partial [Scytosiphon promiscuus]
MDADVYIYFPRDPHEDNGWDQMVQRYRALFYAHGVRPHQALAQPGTPLPTFPRVGRVAQRHDEWDFY